MPPLSGAGRQLFFYGVLMDGVAPDPVRRLLDGLGPGRPGHVRGWLFACHDPHGCYPVLLPHPRGGVVRGMLYRPGTVDLAALDRFEQYDPADPAGSPYLRDDITAWSVTGVACEAQAYIWNRPLGADHVPVRHGDFASYLAETGLAPFSG